MRVSRHRIESDEDGENDRYGERPGVRGIGDARRAAQAERPADPWRQQPEPEQDDHAAARAELPPVEADLPDRPGECCDDEHRIDPERHRFAHQQQPGGNQEHQPGEQIEDAAAERDEPEPAAAECKPDDDEEDGGDDDRHKAVSR